MKVVAVGIVEGREDVMKVSVETHESLSYRRAVALLVNKIIQGVVGYRLNPENVIIEISVDDTGVGKHR